MNSRVRSLSEPLFLNVGRFTSAGTNSIVQDLAIVWKSFQDFSGTPIRMMRKSGSLNCLIVAHTGFKVR